MDCGSSVLPEARNINALEEAVWRRACAWARVEFVAVLERLDLTLMEERPEQLRNAGFRERTLVTRVGELRFRRRCYRDAETGKYRHLLDEALELAPRVRLSDGLVADGVALAAEHSFRQSAGLLDFRVSHTTLHVRLQRAGAALRREVETRRHQVFSLGRRVTGTVQRVATLFCEADGVIIRMQRETRKLVEAKLAIIYEGWERLHPSSSEYRLRSKLAYASFQGAKAFWESLSVLAGQRWDLSAVKVIGGDGADWIKQGLGYFAGAAYQLCRFHLARKIRDCLGGGQAFQRVYDVRNRPGRLLVEARDAVAAALDPEQEERARVLLDYLVANRDGLDEYRRRLEPGGLELRGLGGIESNVDKLISNRMKKRGMAWRLDGARNMLAVITLRANGQLRSSGEANSDLPIREPAPPGPPGRPRRRVSPGLRSVHMPGLDSGRPLARLLRPFTKVYPPV
jgi:hypothetical protein